MRAAPSLSRLAAVAAGLTLALASCAAPTEGEDAGAAGTSPAAVETTTEAAPTEESTETEEPTETVSAEPSDTGLIELEMEDTFTTENGSEITVHEVQVNIPYRFESDSGGGWHAIDVSYCISDVVPDLDAFQSFDHWWVLRTEEGYTLDYPSSHWDDIASPQLELFNTMPAANECYRGWILIDGPADATVTSARFYEVDWSLPEDG